MKRRFAVFFALITIVLTTAACAEPFEPKLSGSLVGFSHATEEVIAAIKEKGVNGNEEAILDALTVTDSYNITPSQIRADTGAEIYKFASNNLTILSVNGSFFKLGDANGGYGVIGILEHDLDDDGIAELYFTYCTGKENKGLIGCYVQASASVLVCEHEFDTPLLAVANQNGGLDLYSATVDYGKFSTENINAQVNALEQVASLILADGVLKLQ